MGDKQNVKDETRSNTHSQKRPQRLTFKQALADTPRQGGKHVKRL